MEVSSLEMETLFAWEDDALLVEVYFLALSVAEWMISSGVRCLQNISCADSSPLLITLKRKVSSLSIVMWFELVLLTCGSVSFCADVNL